MTSTRSVQWKGDSSNNTINNEGEPLLVRTATTTTHDGDDHHGLLHSSSVASSSRSFSLQRRHRTYSIATSTGDSVVCDPCEPPPVVDPKYNQTSFFVTTGVFMACGMLLRLQSALRSHLFIERGGGVKSDEHHHQPSHTHHQEMIHSGSPAAYLYGFCVSTYYIGLLLMRLGHNVVFGAVLTPRQRVVTAMGIMAFAMMLIVLLFYIVLPHVGVTGSAAEVKSHRYAMLGVLAAYFLGGVSVGTFEPNVMSCITPLGKKNKSLAAIGVGFGANGMAIVVLSILSRTVSYNGKSVVEGASYAAAAMGCICGAIAFRLRIPDIDLPASHDMASIFVTHFRNWRCWVPLIRYPLIVSFLDEFCQSLSLAIAQYMYGSHELPLLYPFVDSKSQTPGADDRQHWIKHDDFMIVYFCFGLVGATLSRYLTFRFKRRNPGWFLGLTFVGIGLILSKAPLLAPIGFFVVMYGNGAIYSSCLRIIDETVGADYNLIALSLWLALGDLGGFCGANAVVPIHSALGTV